MKNKLVSVSFLILLFVLFLWGVLLPDQAVSQSERRKLAQFPTFTLESVLDKSFFSEYDEYLLDQFPLRDGFRSIKAWVSYHLLRQTDNNGIYLLGDMVCKMEYPLREGSVASFVKKLNQLQEEYLSGSKVYYAIIPDKNYYAAPQTGVLSLDYERMYSLVQEGVVGAEYIELRDCLRLEDYYRTDSHWRQERLSAVVERLGEHLGFQAVDLSEYQQEEYKPFYGVYYGQSALALKPDALYYLTNAHTQGAQVHNLQDPDWGQVYQPEKLTGMDSYDVFLSGATPLITITNPNSSTQRELLLFRDSYGSSLAPLLIEQYRTITLIDLRYMVSTLLPDYVDFHGQDVLFLYSTGVVNSADMLR